MNHYVCPGCGTIMGEQILCATVGCSMIGIEMVGCNCEDGLHNEAINGVT